MIIGLGNDLIDIRRIEKTLAEHGERFTCRIFTEIERAKSERRANRAASYAKRFAAKEACAKALGTGLHQGVFWRDMGVVNLPSGAPTLALTGGAAAFHVAATTVFELLYGLAGTASCITVPMVFSCTRVG